MRIFRLFTLIIGLAFVLTSGLTRAQEAADSGSAKGGAPAEIQLSSEITKPGIDPAELSLRLIPLTKDELGQLTEAWAQLVKSKTEEVIETQIAISRRGSQVDDAVRDQLMQLGDERKRLFDKFSVVVNAWEKKGGDEKAIADYRAYRNAIIIEQTRTADFETLVARTISWLTAEDGGIQLAKQIGVIILSLLGLLIVSGIARRFARRWIDRIPNISKLLQAFLVGVVYWIVFAVGLMIVLSALGVDITPLFALIGGGSFVAAFALQDTLGNLASGLMIMIYRPFDEGDYVDVGGVAGTVKAVSIVATTVVTPDNQVIVIPNKNVWGNIITNVTASDTRRVDLVFGISYDDSIPDAIRVLEETVAAHSLVLKEPEPTVRVNELADSSVNLICRPWVKTSDYWSVYWDLTHQVKDRFDDVGISIPYPQQDIHVKNSVAEKSAFTSQSSS